MGSEWDAIGEQYRPEGWVITDNLLETAMRLGIISEDEYVEW